MKYIVALDFAIYRAPLRLQFVASLLISAYPHAGSNAARNACLSAEHMTRRWYADGAHFE